MVPEKMPEVLAQTNYDQKKWEVESAWETEHTMKLASKEESKTVIDTDWEKPASVQKTSMM